MIAVRHAVDRALEKARREDGPSLIEALSYRMGDHTTADNASRYRSAEEVERYGRADPIARLRAYLLRTAGWREEDRKKLAKQVLVTGLTATQMVHNFRRLAQVVTARQLAQQALARCRRRRGACLCACRRRQSDRLRR